MSDPHPRGEPASSDPGTHTQFSKSQAAGMAPCPADAVLTSFLDETLPEDTREALSTHIDHCAGCQDRLDRLTNDTEGAVARIKAHSVLLHRGPRESSLEVTSSDSPSPETPDSPRFPRVPGYDVLELIGKGGMGLVYRARHRRLNRLVALKMISAGIHADPRTVQRFFFEAEVMARVRHPQVVEVFEANVYQGPDGVPVPYLAMELLEGGTLRNMIKQGPRPPSEAAKLMEGVARAVHCAHLQGIIHRDLKPGNILFGTETASEKGSPESDSVLDSDLRVPSVPSLPKVGDFGLAKLMTPLDEDLTTSGQVIGTPAYMAPEQAAGDAVIGPEVDVYALGTILFEMLVGHPPFQGREAMKLLHRVMQEAPPALDRLRPDLPRDLAAVAMKCLEKPPERRYRSAEEFADDLRRFRENRPTAARPLTTVERTWRLARRNPAVASLLTTLAGVLIVGVATVFALWQRAERTAVDERRAKEESVASERVAAEALKLADARQARLEFDRGVSLCEDGQVEAGLRHFERAREQAQANGAADLARAAGVNLAVWPRTLATKVRTFPLQDRARAVAFDRGGTFVIGAGSANRLTRWDEQSSNPGFSYSAPKDGATGLDANFLSATVNAEGQTVATGAEDGRIWAWTFDRSRPPLTSIPTGGGAVTSVVFAPDGTLWAADATNGAKRWNLETGQVVAEASGRMLRSPVQTLALSTDGRRLYLGDRSGFVFEWDTMDKRISRAWPMVESVVAIALSGDNSTLAATGPGGRCMVVDLNTNRIDHDINLRGAAGKGVGFSRSGDLVLVADSDGNVRAFHRATGQPVGVPLRFNEEITGLRTRPDSDEFAVASGESITLCRWSQPGGQPLLTGVGRVTSIAFDPAGDKVTVNGAKQATVIDLADAAVPQKTYPITEEPAMPPEMMRILDRSDRRGERIACWGRRLELVNLINTDSVRKGFSLPDVATTARYSPDGSRILVGLQNNSAVWVDAMTGQELVPPLTHSQAVTSVAISPDATVLLTGSRDGTARLWDAATGLPLGPTLRHAGPVTAVAFSPTGKQAATGTSNGHALLWSAPPSPPAGPSGEIRAKDQ